jgi:hypothetical protein
MDSKTVLGHTFPNADLSPCYWLPSRDLAYRKSRIASLGDFSLSIRLSLDLMISMLHCECWISLSGSCFHRIMVMVTFVSPVGIAGCGKEASTSRLCGETNMAQKSAVGLPYELESRRIIHIYPFQLQCEEAFPQHTVFISNNVQLS